MKTEFSELVLGQLRASTGLFNEGDLEAAFAGVAENVEWHQGDWIPDGTTIYGRRRLIDHFKRLSEVGGWSVTIVDADDMGDGTLLVEELGHWTGRLSGLEGDRRFFGLFDFSGRQLVRVREFETREEALAAAQAGGSSPAAA